MHFEEHFVFVWLVLQASLYALLRLEDLVTQLLLSLGVDFEMIGSDLNQSLMFGRDMSNAPARS